MSNEPQTSKGAAEHGGWPLLQTFQSEMNRFFDRFNNAPLWRESQMIAAINVAETDAAIEVTVDVPGVDQKDLDVTVSHENLIIRGTKSDEREDESKDWHLMERSYGSFRRVVPLGFTPEDDKVDATHANGVLTLKIAKPEGASTSNRKIEIKAG